MTNILDQCQVCSKQGKVFRCSKCKVARYCSVECQKKDWIAGHRKTCLSVTKNQDARAHRALAELFTMTQGISVSEAKQRQDQASDRVEKQKKQDLLQKTTIRFPKKENEEIGNNKSTADIDRKEHKHDPSVIKSEPELSSTRIKNFLFFLEEMKYIHQFQVSLRPKYPSLQNKDAYQMMVRATSNGYSRVNFKSLDGSMEFSINLPRRIIPNQSSWNCYPEDGTIQLRLPFQESSSSRKYPELVPVETLTPVEIINRIQCRQCHQALLATHPIQRTYFLPKGNWDEIADYLSCYGGTPVVDFSSSAEVESLTAAQDANALCLCASDLDATVSVMAVSGYGESSSSFLAAPGLQPLDSAVVRGNRQWQDATGGGAPVCCTQCGSVLGFAPLESPENFRLLRHRLEIGKDNKSSADENIPGINDDSSDTNLELGSCASFLAREMVRYAEAKAIFTFVIGMDCGAAEQYCQPVRSMGMRNKLAWSTTAPPTQQGGKKCLLLRLVSWDTIIATEASDDGGLKFQKVAKLVYEEAFDEIGNKNSPNHWVWGGVDLCCALPGSVKETDTDATVSTVRLELPLDEYEAVQQELQAKSGLFPKSIKDATILMKMGAQGNTNDMDLTVIPLS